MLGDVCIRPHPQGFVPRVIITTGQVNYQASVGTLCGRSKRVQRAFVPADSSPAAQNPGGSQK
jgi:hypothetical protein